MPNRTVQGDIVQGNNSRCQRNNPVQSRDATSQDAHASALVAVATVSWFVLSPAIVGELRWFVWAELKPNPI
jgi:hypothetical protein